MVNVSRVRDPVRLILDESVRVLEKVGGGVMVDDRLTSLLGDSFDRDSDCDRVIVSSSELVRLTVRRVTVDELDKDCVAFVALVVKVTLRV
jgi:hypothetical protein